MDPATKPLTTVPAGSAVLITAMPDEDDIRKRLRSMGLDLGSRVEVITTGGNGPVLVGIGETRLAIERTAAQEILVAPDAPRSRRHRRRRRSGGWRGFGAFYAGIDSHGRKQGGRLSD